MAKLKNPFRDLKVEYSRSHPLTKVVVIVLIVLSMAALIALGWSQADMRRQIEAVRREVAQLESENQDLREKIDQLDSVEGMEHIAQDELGLVDPNTIIIDPNP